MPFIIIITGGTDTPPPKGEQRAFSGIMAYVTAFRAFSGLQAVARTEGVRVFSGLPVTVRTYNPVDDLPLPGGGTVGSPGAPPAGAQGYIITHNGLPAPTTDYTIGMSWDGGLKPKLPSLSATVRGKAQFDGNISVGVVVSGTGGTLAQVYGPFGVLGYTHERTPTGWVTRVQSLDSSAADAEAEGPLMPIFEQEYLPWEKERDLTPYQQALKARNDALIERALERQTQSEIRAVEKQLRKYEEVLAAPEGTGSIPTTNIPEAIKKLKAQLKDLRKKAKPIPDRRNIPVQDVIQFALRSLPLPFELKGALPFAGDRFWASEDTGVEWRGGTLKGVSFQVKGKTPVQVLGELLEPVGWEITTKFGVVTIGPPDPLEEAAQTPGLLEIPEDMLTGITQEIINPNVGTTGGNAQLPRRITIIGAATVKKLPPLPPLPDDEEEEERPYEEALKEKDFTWTETGVDVEYNGEVVGTWRHTKNKRGGLLVSEEFVRQGWIADGLQIYEDGNGYQVHYRRWDTIERRLTTYTYGVRGYPNAEVLQETRVYGAVPHKKGLELIQSIRVETAWAREGWMERKTSVTSDFTNFVSSIDLSTGKIEYAALVSRTIVTEAWTPINKDTWNLIETETRDAYHTYFTGDGEPDTLLPGKKTQFKSTLTDQGPPRAPDETQDRADREDEKEEPEEGEGFPYEEPLEGNYDTNGRGDPVTRSVPWATSIDPQWKEQVIAATRRARTAQRTTYRLAAPPKVEMGSRIKEFRLTGRAASVQADVTVEEAISDVL